MLSDGGNSAQGWFFHDGALVDFFEESGAEGIGDFKNGGKDALG